MATYEPDDSEDLQTVRLEQQESGGWVIVDEATGVTTQGETRHQAINNLDEALAAYRGENTHPPSDRELRDIGIDPDKNTSDDGEIPSWMDVE